MNHVECDHPPGISLARFQRGWVTCQHARRQQNSQNETHCHDAERLDIRELEDPDAYLVVEILILLSCFPDLIVHGHLLIC
jgi:hypothetical protein